MIDPATVPDGFNGPYAVNFPTFVASGPFIVERLSGDAVDVGIRLEAFTIDGEDYLRYQSQTRIHVISLTEPLEVVGDHLEATEDSGPIVIRPIVGEDLEFLFPGRDPAGIDNLAYELVLAEFVDLERQGLL